MTEQPVWTETDSRDFLDLAEIAVPAREERTRALFDLVSATLDAQYRRRHACASFVGTGHRKYG